MVDRVALVPELCADSAVTISTLVFRMYGFDSDKFVCVAVRSLAEIVVVRRTGQSASLQEMFQGVIAA